MLNRVPGACEIRQNLTTSLVIPPPLTSHPSCWQGLPEAVRELTAKVDP